LKNDLFAVGGKIPAIYTAVAATLETFETPPQNAAQEVGAEYLEFFIVERFEVVVHYNRRVIPLPHCQLLSGGSDIVRYVGQSVQGDSNRAFVE